MFDVAPSELLLVAIVAIVVIGPKDLPLALRTAGRWIGKIRRVSNHFRAGIETMIREAEMEEMERKWREQNATIMAQDATKAAEGQTPEAAADQVAAPGVILKWRRTRRRRRSNPRQRSRTQTDAPRLL
jgi:sec-independent protein translocase protein TatB